MIYGFWFQLYLCLSFFSATDEFGSPPTSASLKCDSLQSGNLSSHSTQTIKSDQQGVNCGPNDQICNVVTNLVQVCKQLVLNTSTQGQSNQQQQQTSNVNAETTVRCYNPQTHHCVGGSFLCPKG